MSDHTAAPSASSTPPAGEKPAGSPHLSIPPPPAQPAVQENPGWEPPPPPPRPAAAREGKSILDENIPNKKGLPWWAWALIWGLGVSSLVFAGTFLERRLTRNTSTVQANIAPLVEHLKELEQRTSAAEASAASASAEAKQLHAQLQESAAALKKAEANTEEWKKFVEAMEKDAAAAGFQFQGAE